MKAGVRRVRKLVSEGAMSECSEGCRGGEVGGVRALVLTCVG